MNRYVMRINFCCGREPQSDCSCRRLRRIECRTRYQHALTLWALSRVKAIPPQGELDLAMQNAEHENSDEPSS